MDGAVGEAVEKVVAGAEGDSSLTSDTVSGSDCPSDNLICFLSGEIGGGAGRVRSLLFLLVTVLVWLGNAAADKVLTNVVAVVVAAVVVAAVGLSGDLSSGWLLLLVTRE